MRIVPVSDSVMTSWSSSGVSAQLVVIRPVQDQFYGDRNAHIEDPFGHSWSIQTHIEDVAPDEMARRAAALAGDG